jgi:hypothetical protein
MWYVAKENLNECKTARENPHPQNLNFLLIFPFLPYNSAFLPALSEILSEDPG